MANPKRVWLVVKYWMEHLGSKTAHIDKAHVAVPWLGDEVAETSSLIGDGTLSACSDGQVESVPLHCTDSPAPDGSPVPFGPGILRSTPARSTAWKYEPRP